MGIGGRGCREEFVFFPSFELDAPGARRTGGADLLQEYRNETSPELPLPESPQALRVPLCCGRPPGCASDAAAAAFVPLGQCPLREQPKYGLEGPLHITAKAEGNECRAPG